MTVDQICVRLSEEWVKQESKATPTRADGSTKVEDEAAWKEKPFTRISKAAQRQRATRSLKELESWGFADEDRSKRWWYSGSRVAGTKEEKEAMMLHTSQLLDAVTMEVLTEVMDGWSPVLRNWHGLRTGTLADDFMQHLKSGYSGEFLPIYMKYEEVRMKEQVFRTELQDRAIKAFVSRFNDILGDTEVNWLEVLHRDRPLEVEGTYVDPRVVYFAVALVGQLSSVYPQVPRPMVQFVTMPDVVTQDVIFGGGERVGRGEIVFRRLRSFMKLLETEDPPSVESGKQVQEAGKPLMEWLQRLRNRLEAGQPLEGACQDCPASWVQRDETPPS